MHEKIKEPEGDENNQKIGFSFNSQWLNFFTIGLNISNEVQIYNHLSISLSIAALVESISKTSRYNGNESSLS